MSGVMVGISKKVVPCSLYCPSKAQDIGETFPGGSFDVRLDSSALKQTAQGTFRPLVVKFVEL